MMEINFGVEIVKNETRIRFGHFFSMARGRCSKKRRELVIKKKTCLRKNGGGGYQNFLFILIRPSIFFFRFVNCFHSNFEV